MYFPAGEASSDVGAACVSPGAEFGNMPFPLHPASADMIIIAMIAESIFSYSFTCFNYSHGAITIANLPALGKKKDELCFIMLYNKRSTFLRRAQL